MTVSWLAERVFQPQRANTTTEYRRFIELCVYYTEELADVLQHKYV
jgi:hypothetical protein